MVLSANPSKNGSTCSITEAESLMIMQVVCSSVIRASNVKPRLEKNAVVRLRSLTGRLMYVWRDAVVPDPLMSAPMDSGAPIERSSQVCRSRERDFDILEKVVPTLDGAPMKYLILIHSNPASRQIWSRFSNAERAEGMKVYAALQEDLAASGELIVTEALADPSLGRRLPATEGFNLVSDGPYAEAKEHLAGFFLVECASFDRAVAIAERVPESGLGLVEVRPILDLAGLEM